MTNSWYSQTKWILLLLAFFSPVGLYLMWKYTDWSLRTKKIISGFIGIFLFLFFLGSLSAPKKATISTTPSPPPVPQAQSAAPAQDKPLAKYEKIDTFIVQGVRAYAHYKYNGTDKPSTDVVKRYMSEIAKQGCGEPKVCNFFLWDSPDAYTIGKDSVQGNASEVATSHKDHLIGYVNSGYAFYSYGVTGNGSSSVTTLDPETSSYIDL